MIAAIFVLSVAGLHYYHLHTPTDARKWEREKERESKRDKLLSPRRIQMALEALPPVARGRQSTVPSTQSGHSIQPARFPDSASVPKAKSHYRA